MTLIESFSNSKAPHTTQKQLWLALIEWSKKESASEFDKKWGATILHQKIGQILKKEENYVLSIKHFAKALQVKEMLDTLHQMTKGITDQEEILIQYSKGILQYHLL
jgi:hypothetical protein